VPDWLWDGASLPVPIEDIVDSHYGLRIREGDDLAELAGIEGGGTVSGLLLPDAKEIWVDAREAEHVPPRRRFTIGHELGHWVLDCGLGSRWTGGVVHCRSSQVREQAAAPERPAEAGAADEPAGDAAAAGERDPLAESEHARALAEYPPAELDANQFAAAVLMPRDLVLAEYERVGGDERKLCERFHVSRLAMQRRLWFLSVPRP